jgi:hypothetical protein
LAAAFQRWVSEARSGDTLNVEIQRGEEVLSVRIRLETPHLNLP